MAISFAPCVFEDGRRARPGRRARSAVVIASSRVRRGPQTTPRHHAAGRGAAAASGSLACTALGRRADPVPAGAAGLRHQHRRARASSGSRVDCPGVVAGTTPTAASRRASTRGRYAAARTSSRVSADGVRQYRLGEVPVESLEGGELRPADRRRLLRQPGGAEADLARPAGRERVQVTGDLVGRGGVAQRDGQQLVGLVDVEGEILGDEFGQLAGLAEPVDRERASRLGTRSPGVARRARAGSAPRRTVPPARSPGSTSKPSSTTVVLGKRGPIDRRPRPGSPGHRHGRVRCRHRRSMPACPASGRAGSRRKCRPRERLGEAR